MWKQRIVFPSSGPSDGSFVPDIAIDIFVLKRDVKHQLTNKFTVGGNAF